MTDQKHEVAISVVFFQYSMFLQDNISKSDYTKLHNTGVAGHGSDAPPVSVPILSLLFNWQITRKFTQPRRLK